MPHGRLDDRLHVCRRIIPTGLAIGMILNLCLTGADLDLLAKQVKLVLDGQRIVFHAAISQRYIDSGINKPLALRCHLPALACLQFLHPGSGCMAPEVPLGLPAFQAPDTLCHRLRDTRSGHRPDIPYHSRSGWLPHHHRLLRW